MFQAVGLKVIDANEIRSDALSKDVCSVIKEIRLFILSPMFKLKFVSRRENAQCSQKNDQRFFCRRKRRGYHAA